MKNLSLNNSNINQGVVTIIQKLNFTENHIRISNYHSDLWIVFRSHLEREKFLQELVSSKETYHTSKFRNQSDDNVQFPYGLEIAFSFNHLKQKANGPKSS